MPSIDRQVSYQVIDLVWHHVDIQASNQVWDQLWKQFAFEEKL